LNIVNNGLDTNGGVFRTISLAILTPKPIFGLVRECADRVERKNRQASAQRPERQKTEEGTDWRTCNESGARNFSRTTMIVFDLFVGAWTVRDAMRNKINHLIVIPCLLIMIMLGPVGLLIYSVIRLVKTRSVVITESKIL
jgi:hypothetical protein